jgi:hypothetical protein
MDWYIIDNELHKESFFASPERASSFELQKQIQILSKSKVLDLFLQAPGHLVAILNSHRQVLAVNGKFLKQIGMDNDARIIGLRPGEVLKCSHAEDMEAGCGTSKYCSTCGAAIAIVTALAENNPVERECIIDIEDNGKKTFCLNVRAVPYEVESTKFILLFLENISSEKILKHMTNNFFPNLNNIFQDMSTYLELLRNEVSTYSLTSATYIEALYEHFDVLLKEVASHKSIINDNLHGINPGFKKLTISSILSELREIFKKHPVVKDKELLIDWNFTDKEFYSDEGILLKILYHMLVNAFEHTEKDVKLWVSIEKSHVIFKIWNSEEIDEKTSMRIFQKFFSTKEEMGHGFGTYAIKFLGEHVLKGIVSFSTSSDGTVFSFSHPIFKK